MQITSPCHQNFSKMHKHGNGRYCGSCQKVVVDFTQMDQKQLINYFKEHKSENVCGRVKNFQIRKQNVFESFLFKFREFVSGKINITPLRIALLAMVSGLMTFTTSCMGKVMYDAPTYGGSKTNKDTIQNSPKKEPSKKQ